MDIIYQNLMSEAKEVSKNAYCPYSNFPVGACVLYESNKTYRGCNVENVSFGLTLCAERNAISKLRRLQFILQNNHIVYLVVLAGNG